MPDQIPVFVLLDLCPPPADSHQQKTDTAALATPGLSGVLFHAQMADHLASRFDAIDYVLSVTPENLMLRMGTVGMPVAADAKYRTVTLDISLRDQTPVSTVLPAIWDPAFEADFVASYSMAADYLRAQGVWDRLHGINFCPIARYAQDMEFQIPSHNPAPYSQDYSSEWIAAGYSEAAATGALARIFSGLNALFAGLPIGFPMLTAEMQQLGGKWDATGAFARSMFDAMLAAAPNGLLVPENLTVTAHSTGSWAATQGARLGRLGLQLGTSPRTPADIQGAVARALTFKPDWLEVHPFQAADAMAYLGSLPASA